jgi:hypothetical protein
LRSNYRITNKIPGQFLNSPYKIIGLLALDSIDVGEEGYDMKRVLVYLQSYRSTLFSTVMLGFVTIHTMEDILLMSIGRFVPLPLIAMYAMGLIVSWLMMGCIVNRLLKRLGMDIHDHH